MVRAIDAQQVILQSNMAEKVQQIQQQNPDMQQRYFALQLSEEDRLLREKVKQADESEKTIIRKKQEQKNDQKGKDKKNRDNAEMLAVGEEGESAEEGAHINIKV
jgi:hypothetical protein